MSSREPISSSSIWDSSSLLPDSKAEGANGTVEPSSKGREGVKDRRRVRLRRASSHGMRLDRLESTREPFPFQGKSNNPPNSRGAPNLEGYADAGILTTDIRRVEGASRTRNLTSNGSEMRGKPEIHRVASVVPRHARRASRSWINWQTEPFRAGPVAWNRHGIPYR